METPTLPAGWNYRVVRVGVHITKDHVHSDGSEYAIYVASYRAGEADPWAISTEPHTPRADTAEQLHAEYQQMLTAFAWPVLEDDGAYLNWVPREPGTFRHREAQP